MKKFIYILTFSLTVAASAFAQNQLLPRVSFGIKGGVNASNFSTTNNITDESKVGFQAGAYSRISLGALHLQPELYYTQKDAKLMQSLNSSTNMVSFKSIDLPILLGYSWGGDEAAGHIQTGPLVAFGISNKQSANAGQNSSSVMIGDQNFAWLFGAGVDVGRLSIDARYEYGLKKNPVTDFTSTVRVNVFSLAVAYRLFAL
ncbi:porin family protein [Mucilaginibacter sp. CSA2-8R]|uniref:porin family protein n=1 Tax=Mucilaginibacter sp. CSA2-8R TaxID=3141542 RepID=UPI00315D142F